MHETKPPVIPQEFQDAVGDLKPVLSMVVKRRKVWVAKQDPEHEWFVRLIASSMIPMSSFLALILFAYVLWIRSSPATKKKIHSEVNKTSILLTKVMERPEVYKNRRSTAKAVVFWTSMTFLLGVYCFGIVLGYDTKKPKRRRHRVSRR
ncbi:hypothetical protein CJU89_6904 [Yarrowia sp. B02]|nr:hypothetical protein CJU89_6904 [Yarrowia sp. B02]